MASSFDAWADVYDSIYAYVREDIPFYVDEAMACRGPVLELGCGTGRVTIPIARAGVDIVGLDSSEAMLRVARQKAEVLSEGAGELDLVHADMRDFSLDRTFDLAIIPFRGFLSLLTVEDQTAALHSIGRHLSPEGKLVFSVFVPDPEVMVQPGDIPFYLRDVTDPDTGSRLVLWHQSTHDNHHQILFTRLIIEELDQDGVMKRRLYRDFQLRYVHRWEMHHLLELCGYRVDDLYGDFDRSPFDETSTEVVWVATKPD